MAKSKREGRDRQVYKLAQYGAIVTIDYDVANPPPFFQPASGIVIVGDHQCAQPPSYAPFNAAASNTPSETNGPTHDTPEMIEWKARRKPLTTEDVAKQSGLPDGVLSFENLSGIAAAMEPVE